MLYRYTLIITLLVFIQMAKSVKSYFTIMRANICLIMIFISVSKNVYPAA